MFFYLPKIKKKNNFFLSCIRCGCASPVYVCETTQKKMTKRCCLFQKNSTEYKKERSAWKREKKEGKEGRRATKKENTASNGENYNVYAAFLPCCLNAVSLCSSYWIWSSDGRPRLSFNFFPMLRILCLLLFDVQIAVFFERGREWEKEKQKEDTTKSIRTYFVYISLCVRLLRMHIRTLTTAPQMSSE